MSIKDVNLSKRMETVVSMVSPQSFTIADVGCDHAYVSIALIARKLAGKVIAMDVRKGPIDIAKHNISEAGYQNEIDIRLGDGLERLQPGEADTIIIAGMGGLLIKGILERGIHILSYEGKQPTLILQPQSDLKEVRMFLYQNAYHIVKEAMLLEDGKYYTVMKAEPSDRNLKEVEYDEVEWLYGRCNLEKRDMVLQEYLHKEHEVMEQILEKIRQTVADSEKRNHPISEATILRMESVQREIVWNEMALARFEA